MAPEEDWLGKMLDSPGGGEPSPPSDRTPPPPKRAEPDRPITAVPVKRGAYPPPPPPPPLPDPPSPEPAAPMSNLFAPSDLFASAGPLPVPFPEEPPPALPPPNIPLPPLGGPAPGLGGPAPGLGGPAPGLGGQQTGRRPAPQDRLFASPDEPMCVERERQERQFAHPDHVEEYRPQRASSWPYLLFGAAAAYFVWTQVHRPREVALPPPPPIILVPTAAPGPPMPRMIDVEPAPQVSVTPEAPGGHAPAAAPSHGDLRDREWLFAGRLRDALTLQPVAAQIVFDDFRSGRKRRVRANARGRFRARLPVPEGNGYFLKIESEGYLDRYILEGEEVSRYTGADRRQRALTATRSVQAIPLSPLAEGRLELDVLLIPAGLE